MEESGSKASFNPVLETEKQGSELVQFRCLQWQDTDLRLDLVIDAYPIHVIPLKSLFGNAENTIYLSLGSEHSSLRLLSKTSIRVMPMLKIP